MIFKFVAHVLDCLLELRHQLLALLSQFGSDLQIVIAITWLLVLGFKLLAQTFLLLLHLLKHSGLLVFLDSYSYPLTLF